MSKKLKNFSLKIYKNAGIFKNPQNIFRNFKMPLLKNIINIVKFYVSVVK